MAVSSDVQKVVDVQKVPDAIITSAVTLVHSGVSTTYATIQAAVNAAVTGDAINIASGTYIEQVIVNGIGNLTFTAAAGVVVRAPADVLQTATSLSGRAVNALFTVLNAANVTFSGGTFDGDARGNTVDGPNANFVGVYYQNSSGGLTNANIAHIRDPLDNGSISGVQRGVGVQVDNTGPADLPFFMTGGSISDFQKNATVFINAALNVTGVTITGSGNQSIIAQNGFQVGSSSGTVANNVVTGIGYSGVATDTYSSSVLLYDNTGLSVTGNTITGANTSGDHTPRVLGIAVYSFGGAGANGGAITGNTINFTDIGIDIEQTAVNGLTVANNTITNSDLTDAFGGDFYIDGITGTGITSSAGAPLMGGASDDFISLGSGNDFVESGAGNDVVLTGDGNDTVIGGDGAGDDFYDGGAGIDTLVYPSTTLGVTVDMNEIDRSSNAQVSAVLIGAGLANTTPVGIATGVEIGTDAFRNFENVTGGSGNDTIYGNLGANVIDGGAGDDLIRGGQGNDTLVGSLGIDTLDYSDNTVGVQVNLATGQVNAGVGNTDTVSGFENAILSGFDDQFIGSANGDTVTGGAGNDQLDGRGGQDVANYTGTVAADGLATQVFGTLQFNAGVNGTDQISNIEILRFTNGADLLNITVDNGNAVVASRNDAATMIEGDTNVSRTVATGVLSNDVNLDQGGADQKVVASVNGSPANLGQPIVGLYGTLTLIADGSYTYVQNQAATNVLRGGQIVTDTFTYTADDGDTGDSASANLVFTITGVNDLPTLGGTTTGSVTEDTNAEGNFLSTSGTLTVTDPDANEAAYQPQTTNNEGRGTFTLSANGNWTYSVNNLSSAVQSLGAGQATTDSFTARSVDGTTIPVTITINGVNDNPVVSGVTFAPLANPTYPFAGDELTIGASVVNGGASSTSPVSAASLGLAVNLGGYFTTLANSDVQDATTIPHVSIRLTSDGTMELFRFTVTAAGIVTIDTDYADLTAGTGVGAGVDTRVWLLDANGVILANDDDSATSEGAGGSIGDFDSFLSFNVTTPGVYYAAIGTFDGSTSGTTVTALPAGFSLEAQISVTNVNNAPPPPRAGNVLTESNTVLATSGNVTFTDVDQNDSPTAAYTAATGFAFTLANGPTLTAGQQTALASAFSIASGGAFSFTTPSPDFLGHDDVLTLTYSVVVSDQHGGTTSTPVTITINGTNDRPVITSAAQGATLAETNAALTASGAVTATDIDNAEVLTYSGVYTAGTVTSGVALSQAQQNLLINAFTANADGTWTYNLASPDFLPAASQVSLTYTVTANDGHGGLASQTVVIVINGTNDAPTILAPNTGGTYSPALLEANAALSTGGKVNFADADINSTPTAAYTAATDATVTATGLTLTAGQIAAIKAGFVLVDAAGNYTFNLASPDYLAAGDIVTATFNVHIVDAQGGDTVQPVTITITGTNDAPVLTGGALFTIADTAAADTFAPVTGSIATASNDVDTDDTETFTLNGSATSTYGTLTLNANGSYSFAVNSAAVNGLLTGQTVAVTYNVTVADRVLVSDPERLTSTADFVITITGRNENPILSVSPLQYRTMDYGSPESFDLLRGASDPDNVEINDLDIANPSVINVSDSGNLTSGQLSLAQGAVSNAFRNTSYNTELGTLTFDTALFDFLDEDQSVTVTVAYTVTDSNGGTVAQTAQITIDGMLEFGFDNGTPFDDYVVGGMFGDYLNAGDGDDEVYGSSGADRIIGGGGDDYLNGASGADTIYGDDQQLFGGEGGFAVGDNIIDAGSGNDSIYGGLGNNVVNAGSGNDHIYIGSAGFFFGGEGGGDSAGGIAKSQVERGEGGAMIDLPSGMNIVDGGSGFDTVHVSGRWSEYTITRVAANTYVFERLNEDDTVEANQYRNIEYFTFDGGEGTPAMLVNHAPTVATAITFSTPEIVSNATVPMGGVLIGNVGAADVDAPLGDTLSYFIDGSGVSNFRIDADGNLLLVNPVDFETGPRVYTLSLLVVDEHGVSDTSTITVTITDANDPVSSLTVAGALTSAELAAAGTVVATATGVDVDAGSSITYSLSDSAGGRYVIDAITGVVTVANGNLLDFEQAASHNITVVATSNDGSSLSQVTAIAVTDVSPETIVGTSASETFLAGAGNDSFTTNITTGGADRVNFGDGLDRVTINATSTTNVLLRFTSAEVGNGNANDSNTLANQDGGLAVRVSEANNVEPAVSRTDDEGMVFVGGTGVTFNVTDLPSGVSRGNAFEVAILGTSGADTLTAVQAARPYYFNAGGGNDSVTGGTANDFLVGGGGDDVLAGLGGNNSYIGGAGIDTVSYTAAPGAIYVDLIGSQSLNGYGGTETFVSGIENVIGSAGNDIVIGDNGNNVITGGGGSDYLIGRGGDDRFIGTAAVASTFQGGTGNDTYVVANVGDSVLEFAGEGTDTVQASIASYTLNAEVENLVYTGTASFTGTGNGIDNSLTGGIGNDTLAGGAGADTFNAIASNGLDVITDFLSGSDRILLDASYTHSATVDFVSGAGAQTATGTNSAFLYDTSTGILSYDADGTGSGAAIALFNLGAGTTLVASDVLFPIIT